MRFRDFLKGLFLLAFLLDEGSAQDLQWQSFTSVGTIRDIDIGSGQVWSGSNGGVLRLQTSNLEITKFTNTDGLSSNEVIAVEIDRHGSVWFAFFNGILNRYWPEQNTWEVVADYRDQVITDLVTFGDSLYVGLDFGVSLYSIDRREVKETYVNLGLSSGGNVEKIGANSVLIAGQDIWVATDKGIAQSSLELPNLQAPASWNQYTTLSGLPTNFINKVVVLDSTPYAATVAGVARLAGGRWEDTGFGTANAISIEVVAANLFFNRNTVVVLTSAGVSYLNDSNQWQVLGESMGDVTALKSDEAGNLWVGRRNRGLATFDFSTQDWVTHEINSPASNNFKSLTVDSKGRLWCASQEAGVHMFDGEVWTNFSTTNGLKSNDQRVAIVDSQDRIWVGSWGGGISIFEESGAGFTITQIDQRNGVLSGFTGDPNFVLVNSLSTDQAGNVWVVNRQASTTQILVAFTSDGNRVYFSQSELVFSPFVNAIEIDRSGRVWIGSEGSGVRVLDHRSTLNDKNDDVANQGLTVSADNILSNNITALIDDRDGVMWIGSDQGVNYWFNNLVRSQFGLINNSVNVIGVDAQNSKWFGTPSGISVLDNDGVIRTSYTTGNSPLVSSNVISFAFNEESGDVWIGTSNGLSLVETPFTAPEENLNLLTGYPNPYIIDGSQTPFFIDFLKANTGVVIYSSSGARVREFASSDIRGVRRIDWDGRDEDGNLVPSGIYVYLAHAEDGETGVGKVAVIRR